MSETNEEKLNRKEAHELYIKNGKKIIDSSSDSFVSLRNIDKVYPNGAQAVYDFNLEISKHDFVALVGPSGCGKSTTLRMIAGLEEISAGQLFIDGAFSNFLPSKDRDIAMVFQSYALYPQLDVFDNIAFGLKIRKMEKEEIEKRVFEAAKILDLGKYLDRKPKELSGGQMQRVALGRALVRKAQLFLMDEPLSNLDAKLRVQMRSEIVRIHEEAKATTIYVTHDQTEAMTMANKIVVMNLGFIQQIGKPLEIYENPNNLFVATFIGSPAMNVLDGIYKDGRVSIDGLTTIELSKDQQKVHDEFISERINYINNQLSKVDTMSEAEVAQERLKTLSATNVGRTQDTITKKAKSNIFKKIANLFKKRKENTEKKENIIEVYRKELEENLASYQAGLKEGHSIKVGIRPESIRLVKEDTKQLEAFEFEANLVEILGSEFIAYGSVGHSSFTIKLQEAINVHESHKYVINTAKIHIYDEKSGLRII